MKDLVELLNQGGIGTPFIIFILITTLISFSAFRTNFPVLHSTCGIVAVGFEFWLKWGIIVYFVMLIVLMIGIGTYHGKEEDKDKQKKE